MKFTIHVAMWSIGSGFGAWLANAPAMAIYNIVIGIVMGGVMTKIYFPEEK